MIPLESANAQQHILYSVPDQQMLSGAFSKHQLKGMFAVATVAWSLVSGPWWPHVKM